MFLYVAAIKKKAMTRQISEVAAATTATKPEFTSIELRIFLIKMVCMSHFFLSFKTNVSFNMINRLQNNATIIRWNATLHLYHIYCFVRLFFFVANFSLILSHLATNRAS